MPVQILHVVGDRIKTHNCLTKKQVMSYLWGLKSPRRNALITIADIYTQRSVNGTQRVLLAVLGRVESLDELFDD